VSWRYRGKCRGWRPWPQLSLALQLLLYTVFRVGSATNNIAYGSYEYFRNHPAVAWTIPYSLGDSHRGFRVVGTTEDFYKNYRYRRDRQVELAEGRIPSDIFDVALGSDVAAELQYRLGDLVIITHGITHGRGLLEHDDKPFTVVGILERTATPVDRSLYITKAWRRCIWTGQKAPRPC
jgi:putative ABC transport system permease protein